MRQPRLPHAVLVLSFLALACSGRAANPASPDPGGERTPTDPTERWIEMLARPNDRGGVVDTLAAELGRELNGFLALVVRDSTAPVIARANALLALGERRARTELAAFWIGLSADDPIVRASAAVGLGGVLGLAERTVVGFLAEALEDPDPQVQARALETLADADVALLREYLSRTPSLELATIAGELVRVAEERGAALEPAAEPAAAEGSPVLARRSTAGPRLEFRPTRTWPHWDASVGELVVTPEGGQALVLSGDVEVVRRVVPAFVSPDGRYVVYEAGREIRVRDLVGGGDRLVGPGVAPRILPFTMDFTFLREIDRAESEEAYADEGPRTIIRYEVVRAPFEGGGPEVLGETTAEIRMSVNGAYSPVRWMRVRERDGMFFLEGPGVGAFLLPDPFGGEPVPVSDADVDRGSGSGGR